MDWKVFAEVLSSWTVQLFLHSAYTLAFIVFRTGASHNVLRYIIPLTRYPHVRQGCINICMHRTAPQVTAHTHALRHNSRQRSSNYTEATNDSAHIYSTYVNICYLSD